MKALVTGGGGFLGGVIVRQLLERGDSVRSFARGAYPELEKLGAQVVRGDLTQKDDLLAAVEGCDVVFHVAAKAGVWGSRRSFEDTNVEGTRNVIEACLQSGVSRLVYTSTPSVVSAGGNVEGVDESAPYPKRFEAEYPRTKAIAEKLVLDANGPNLSTVALRPHLIWGPGDTQFIPRLIARAKAGRLRLVGDGRSLVDVIYVDNAAEAHLLAADKLAPDSVVAGKAYFLSQGEPIAVADMINGLLKAAGLDPVTRSISPTTAEALGGLLEFVYAGLRIEREPPMTRFLARQLSTAHWFDISAAKRDLGYRPRVSTSEGLERLAKALAQDRASPRPIV